VIGEKVAVTLDNKLMPARYLDLEMSCWDTTPPSEMKQEIIEIGIVELDSIELKISRARAYFVRPCRWEISTKCTRWTGIAADEIRKAQPLHEVVLALIVEKFAPAQKLSYAWGNDLDVITSTCQPQRIDSPCRKYNAHPRRKSPQRQLTCRGQEG